MTNGEIDQGDITVATTLASNVFKVVGLKRRVLSPEEGLVMNAASYALDQEDQFYGLEIVRFTALPAGTVYPILSRCEERYRMIIGAFEDGSAVDLERPLRRLYQPTEFGHRIFALFQPEIPGSAE